MNKYIVSLATLLIAGTALGKVGQRNLEEDVKFRRVCIPHLAITVPGTDTTVGQGGLIAAATVQSVTTVSIVDGGSTLSSMPYPAKLTVKLNDASANDTLECDAVVIGGKDQFGEGISETVALADETAVSTTKVFGRVTSVSATGCTAGTDAGDTLNVYPSLTVGLTVKVSRADDVESVCLDDNSAEIKCAAYDDGSANDIASKVDLTNHAYDLTGGQFASASAVDADGACFIVRSSKR